MLTAEERRWVFWLKVQSFVQILFGAGYYGIKYRLGLLQRHFTTGVFLYNPRKWAVICDEQSPYRVLFISRNDG